MFRYVAHRRAGTPTPNTDDASVDSLQPLLAFLHQQPYGTDERCWSKAVKVGGPEMRGWGGTLVNRQAGMMRKLALVGASICQMGKLAVSIRRMEKGVCPLPSVLHALQTPP